MLLAELVSVPPKINAYIKIVNKEVFKFVICVYKVLIHQTSNAPYIKKDLKNISDFSTF